MNYKSAFKAYDIRGVYGEEIDEHFSYIMGKAIGAYFAQHYDRKERFLIASDVRKKNNKLIKAFELGAHTTNPDMIIEYAAFHNKHISSKKYPYGICSSSAAYFLGSQDYALSVIFTASHNPPEYVGMKFFFKDVNLFPTTDLEKLFEKHYEPMPKIKLKNIQKQSLPKFLKIKKTKLIQELCQKRKNIEKKYHFIVDFSNGAGVSVEKDFFEQLKTLGHTIDYINDKPDGKFSSHLSETQDPENYEQLIQEIQRKGADFGLMFDGDVDRIGFVSNKGQIIAGDIAAAIISKKTIKESQEIEPTILYEVMSSQTIPETVKKFGGQSKLVRVGRFFINQYLREAKGIFAGETSGHFLFKEMGYHEMPPLALYYFVKELDNYPDTDRMLKSYKKYYKCPVISIKNIDKQKAIDKVKIAYAQHEQKTIDGISIYGDKFWFNLRPSNTEPKIKFTLEADTEEIMNTERKKLEKLLHSLI